MGLLLIYFASIIIMCSGCEKLIEVNAPYTSINAENVYNDDATATSVLTGIYAKISNQNWNFNSNGNLGNIPLITGLTGDEIVLFNKNNIFLLSCYNNSILSNNAPTYWSECYNNIFVVNSAIEGLNSSKSLNPKIKNQLLGEAKFIRAYAYFYLVNFYGDVPLILSTDPLKNAVLKRTLSADIYDQIESDLEEAKNLLSEQFVGVDLLSSSNERIRPTKWAACALLARVYLYRKKYNQAETEASKIIEQSLFELVDINDVFLKNSKEAIWQLQSVHNIQANTGEGQYFILPDTGPSTVIDYPIYLSENIVRSFDAEDLRMNLWVDSIVTTDKVYYYPHKYKIGRSNNGLMNEYPMMIRLGEILLIRAEARAQLNNIAGSQSDINEIRFRAGLSNTNASNKVDLLNSIIHERQMELFTENGHRWFDLIRSNKIDSIMTIEATKKGGVWNHNYINLPIPNSDLLANPNLTQNPGYTN
ncbi:RagB/SusD family nutrient uptake outer membrane protein [Chitinophaga sancti]|uniref:RagB/SusD family nutrient uptake outer membrane protein n=1 Tax=Chitinophaga sancti TaxID=1004 RepID=UPI002A74E3E9|nr:RagB/SusD family nutrient uptake outer membrane protein [Chitinophaga sancti]WPQ63343.1 RagB/SusD family nutrient uptake outer membrane protein [Chitinophaga sancti]